MQSLLIKFENNRTFTEGESWMLFRLTAIAEACGWTLLITGIALERYVLHGNTIPVLIAGQFHGVLFLSYALSSVGLYPTLRWSRKRAFIALLASIPPYGSLIFEWWARSSYQRDRFNAYTCCIALSLLEAS
jgi:integral membrane protein